MCKERRDVLLIEEMRRIDECDIEEFGTLSSEKQSLSYEIDGDHRWRNGKKIRLLIAKAIYVTYGKT